MSSARLWSHGGRGPPCGGGGRGTYISPYNDPAIIAGQATVEELFRQLESFDGLFIAVGGGGLLSGTAGYLAGVGEVEVVACSQPVS